MTIVISVRDESGKTVFGASMEVANFAITGNGALDIRATLNAMDDEESLTAAKFS